MLERKRAAMALLTAALLSFGACEDQGRNEVDEPSGDVDEAPGGNIEEPEATDEPGD